MFCFVCNFILEASVQFSKVIELIEFTQSFSGNGTLHSIVQVVFLILKYIPLVLCTIKLLPLACNFKVYLLKISIKSLD